MRFVFTAVVGVSMAATPLLSGAQNTDAARNAQTRPPVNEMQSLTKAFSGSWSLKVTFEPSKESPDGLSGTGNESWHAGPDGLILTDEEVFHAGPEKIIVVGIIWRDLKTNTFHAMDCSNQNPHSCDLKGAADGVVVHWTRTELTIEEQETSDGKMMVSRGVWSHITPNSFTETGYLGTPGGTFRKVITILATREAAN
jgi:hypothetical protein